MKMHSEADMDEQMQEMKTITRLQGQPAAGVASCPPPHGGSGAPGGRTFSFNTGTVQGQQASGQPTAHPPDRAWKGIKGASHAGGRGEEKLRCFKEI